MAWQPAALGQADSASVVQARAVWDQPQAHPGDQRILAVVLDIAENFHINADAARIPASESFLIPTAVSLVPSAPGVLAMSPTRFPATHDIEVSFLFAADKLPVFEGQTIIYIPVTVSPDATPGELAAVVRVTVQACDALACFAPTEIELPASLTIVASQADIPPPSAEVAALFAGFDDATATASAINFYFFSLDATGPIGVALLLLVAAVGGLLLNFTPCVLPVIPIKVMSLSKTAGSRGRTLVLGLAMTAGIVGFWLAIAVAIATLAEFRAANDLFQRPLFTVAVGLVIAVFAVGMCGVFSLRLPNWVYSVSPKQESILGSVGFGVMTAVLSTPCTAPFMGAAAGWATLQAAPVTLLTFGAIGVGMALPYLLLAAFPALVARVPRTGPGSELLKQVMGLLMLAAAAYFVGVGLSIFTAKPPAPPTLLYWWPVMALIAAAGGWMVHRVWQFSSCPYRRATWTVVGLVTIALAALGGVELTDRGPVNWVYYTPEQFAQSLAEGNVVVVDFTAEWCLNCKALEHRVLYSEEVSTALNSRGVVPMKVDISSSDNLVGRAMLESTGRVTIPLLVVYAPNGDAVLTSDFYTADQVLAAIRAAQGDGAAAMR